MAFVSLISLGRLWRPRRNSVLYLHKLLLKASPKAVSGRTSYLRVRLEFLPYPHLIPAFFNRRGLGPPDPFTNPSTWTRIDHPVSGLIYMTLALFTLAFTSAPYLLVINLAIPINSPDRSTKSTRWQWVAVCSSLVSLTAYRLFRESRSAQTASH